MLESGDPGDVPAVREGRAGVQDAGSQLVALALTRAEVEGRDERWLDLCAGPGGKAALLAALGAPARSAPASPTSGSRTGRVLVRQALRATGGDVVVGDGTRPAWPTGHLRPGAGRRPLHRSRGAAPPPGEPVAAPSGGPRDLVPLQRALLVSALDSTRPGGVVAYATCSPVVDETAGVVESVLAERTTYGSRTPRRCVPEATDAASAHLAGAVQLWPHRHGTDAMFLALLRRDIESPRLWPPP